MLSHLGALVPGQRAPQLLRQEGDCSGDGVPNGLCAMAGQCGAVLHTGDVAVTFHARQMQQNREAPRSCGLWRSTPRTRGVRHAAPLAADQATSRPFDQLDPNVFSYAPSQSPKWALRRSIESAEYVSIKYTERLKDAGVEPSVGSVGDSYDNALAETINGLYKAEVIWRRGPWRNFEAVEFATLEWVDWFNNKRLLEPIGNIPPAEAEARYYAQTAGHAMAA